MTAPALPRPLAKQIDRLARRAHAFHRFAHHPLCDSYRSEVVRIGRKLRVCKGCAMLVGGFVAGVAIGGLFQPSAVFGLASWSVAIALGLSSLRRRLPKAAARLLPGAGLGFGLWVGWPCAVLSLATMAICFVLYRRRGVERSRCEHCHERERRPCSGFTLIVRRERAFQRRADGWIARHGRGVSDEKS